MSHCFPFTIFETRARHKYNIFDLKFNKSLLTNEKYVQAFNRFTYALRSERTHKNKIIIFNKWNSFIRHTSTDHHLCQFTQRNRFKSHPFRIALRLKKTKILFIACFLVHKMCELRRDEHRYRYHHSNLHLYRNTYLHSTPTPLNTKKKKKKKTKTKNHKQKHSYIIDEWHLERIIHTIIASK